MKKILVLGGGFGGLTAITKLKRYAGKLFDVTLIDKNNYSLFTPMLPEVVSGNVTPDNIVFPLREITKKNNSNFIRDTVLYVDRENKLVKCEKGEYHYDYLIIATGSTTNFRGNKTAEEHCFEYKSISDGIALKYFLIELLEAAVSTPKEERRRILSFSIIGGGITGVELACELVDFIKLKIKKDYSSISYDDFEVTIFEYAKNILPAIDESQSIKAQQYVEEKGIKIINNASVDRVSDGVIYYNQNGEVKEHLTNIIVWTAGVKAQDFLKSVSNERLPDGRIKVNKNLTPVDAQNDGIFVIGDSSAYEYKGKVLPPVAPLAMQQATIAVKNILNLENGFPLQDFKYIHFGYLVSLGKNNSVVNLFGLKFRGAFAYILWKLVYIYKIGMLRKQLGVFFDWVMVTLFGNEASLIMNVEGCPGGVLKSINGYTIKVNVENCKRCSHCVIDVTGKITCGIKR
ncbi:NAD(P)/FAD-dependent oxidoreductase [Calditerrivibrio nitroreducens]|uniref:FAD-dependent pyridine nucleotide-disulfide oxidoreductase n=1 Tax=Calditerrivibrio nitroreducens (strain DSM 19672 / NBRC 101217 / Yu37-1) TaxID=768670 RepID=E4TFC7_CALNY|nr:NAD(P)/FAD-dependent oxidoreductase [Calditerrivibrio nitroreducens]ADR18466.1 FAD-dependent pyridine nucleotide-disulfide oxidoreductase [Calditerrivibrio nitroreducens DSM 19672]